VCVSTDVAFAVLLEASVFTHALPTSGESGLSLFFAKTKSCIVNRYYLHGPMKGTFDVFADNLPGFPDNIRLARNGSLWVPIAAVRTAEDNLFAQMPKLRTLLTKVHHHIQWFMQRN
jgi:ribose transport system permease protein